MHVKRINDGQNGEIPLSALAILVRRGFLNTIEVSRRIGRETGKQIHPEIV